MVKNRARVNVVVECWVEDPDLLRQKAADTACLIDHPHRGQYTDPRLKDLGDCATVILLNKAINKEEVLNALAEAGLEFHIAWGLG